MILDPKHQYGIEWARALLSRRPRKGFRMPNAEEVKYAKQVIINHRAKHKKRPMDIFLMIWHFLSGHPVDQCEKIAGTLEVQCACGARFGLSDMYP